MAETTHDLKSIARNMGADTLAKVAYELEQTCEQGIKEDLSSVRETFQQHFHHTKQVLEKTLERTQA